MKLFISALVVVGSLSAATLPAHACVTYPGGKVICAGGF